MNIPRQSRELEETNKRRQPLFMCNKGHYLTVAGP